MFRSLGALVSACGLMLASAAMAQPVTIPPLVKIVVPFAAGASTDIIARSVAVRLGARLGTNVIVENRPGANGMIGANAVVNGPRDGSVLMVFSNSLLTVAATTPKMPFDVTKDLIPIAVLGEGPLVLGVTATSNIKTPADLVAAARARPDSITHGTGGTGTIAHMAAELINESAKIQMKHIPYRGASYALVDMSAGTIDMMIAQYSTLAPGIKGGRVRPIAVTTSRPSAEFPNLPIMATAAPGFSVSIWVGLWAPAGTPPSLVQRLNHEVNELTKSKDYAEVLKADGNLPVALTPAELSVRVRDDYTTWKKLATAKNIVLE